MQTWEIVRRWLDPRTQAKVEILSAGAETNRRLLDFVSPENVPRSYGGTGPEFYVPVPHAEYLTIPRGSMVRKLIEVEAQHSLTVDSYLLDGDLVKEVYSVPHNVHHQHQSHHQIQPSHEVLSYSTTSHRPSGKEALNHLRLPMRAASSDLSGPTRELHRFSAGDQKRVFTVIWSNTAKLVGRQLTYCLSVTSDVPVAAAASEASREKDVDRSAEVETETADGSSVSDSATPSGEESSGNGGSAALTASSLSEGGDVVREEVVAAETAEADAEQISELLETRLDLEALSD